MDQLKLLKLIEKEKIIAIIRKVYGDDLLFLVDTLITAGIKLFEVTFDQKDPDCINKTCNSIDSILHNYKSDCNCGAGTVLSCEQVKAAVDAGAALIISPNSNEKVIRYTKKLESISIPGAMTSTEIIGAHECGADFVRFSRK